MRRTAVLLGAVALGALIGCAGSDEVRIRPGTTPFPAPFMLYSFADPDDLGPHQSRPHLMFAKENGKGLLYTCDAGFLDLSHLRETIDLSYAFTRHCRAAMLADDERFEVEALYPGVFHAVLQYPPGWEDLNAAARAREIDRLSIEIGIHLAWISTIWHEIITAFGYKYTLLLSEEQSAFTWDDTMSHVIGLDIARRALTEAAHDDLAEERFDQAVTSELAAALAELNVVSKDDCRRAVRVVEGTWWTDGAALKRQTDIGEDDGVIEAWLIAGFDACAPADSWRSRGWTVPTLRDALLPGGGSMLSVEIDPRIAQERSIRAVLPGEPERIVPERDIPILMQYLRQEYEARYGPGFDQPNERIRAGPAVHE